MVLWLFNKSYLRYLRELEIINPYLWIDKFINVCFMLFWHYLCFKNHIEVISKIIFHLVKICLNIDFEVIFIHWVIICHAVIDVKSFIDDIKFLIFSDRNFGRPNTALVWVKFTTYLVINALHGHSKVRLSYKLYFAR